LLQWLVQPDDLIMAGRLGGFAAPLDLTGKSSLYGPPPWHFRGRSMTVICDCEPLAAAALVPAPLEIIPDAPVRITIHDLVCDIGFGSDFAARNPDRTTVREAVVALAVHFEGVEGFYDPFLYCDSVEEISVGREMFGWPQLDASIWMTPPDAVTGVRPGHRLTGKVLRKSGPVLDISMLVDDQKAFPESVPAFSTFYTMRVLPDPTNLTRKVEVFQSYMSDIGISDANFGQAELTVAAPELMALNLAASGPARCNAIMWTKNRSRRIHSQELAPDEWL
jgi:acetoacetate decarboxylase